MEDAHERPIHYHSDTIGNSHKAEEESKTWDKAFICSTFPKVARKQEKDKAVQEKYQQREESEQHIDLADVLHHILE